MPPAIVKQARDITRRPGDGFQSHPRRDLDHLGPRDGIPGITEVE
jgi:hypothetical protein